MPEKTRIYLPLALSVTLALGMLLGAKMRDKGPVIEFLRAEKELSADASHTLEEIVRYIEARYVDSMDRDTLYQSAISAILSRLDPHSAWLSAEEVRKVQEGRDGQFSGIGLEYMIVEDSVWVLRALPGSPASEAGIEPGDRLIQIGDTMLEGTGTDQARIARLMRGEIGSQVNLRIAREGRPMMDISLRRSKVSFPSVMPGVMLDDSCGYIAIQRFGSTTYREFMEQFEVLQRDKGMRHLLIDLRGNPGGYLEESTNILSQLFLEKDRLLVYTLDKRRERKEYRTTGKIFFPLDRIVVLVDETSASASEVVAGAIQDWDRGLVVGRPTFGKGLVQEQYPLKDGSAILLTTARYYTPSGRSIQRHQPKSGELAGGKDSLGSSVIPLGSSPSFSTSKGRTVYGGGGIQPDVPFPPTLPKTASDVRTLQPLMHGFLFTELKVKKQPSESNQVWERFERYVAFRRPELSAMLGRPYLTEVLKIQLLGDMARALGGEALQQETLTKIDGEIRKAHDILRNRAEFESLQR